MSKHRQTHSQPQENPKQDAEHDEADTVTVPPVVVEKFAINHLGRRRLIKEPVTPA